MATLAKRIIPCLDVKNGGSRRAGVSRHHGKLRGAQNLYRHGDKGGARDKHSFHRWWRNK